MWLGFTVDVPEARSPTMSLTSSSEYKCEAWYGPYIVMLLHRCSVMPPPSRSWASDAGGPLTVTPFGVKALT